jgi:hypothetical protein
MSLLTIVNAAQRRLGLNVTNTVAGNSDETASQLLALLNQAGEELAQDFGWQAITFEATFTTAATESQGAMETIAPGWAYIVNDTIWNRTENEPFQLLSSQEWQRQKSASVTGPGSLYRIRGGELIMNPVPTAGQTCAFEYVSKYWATDSTGATGKAAFTADADVARLDEQLLTLSLLWRFKQANGLEFAPELSMFESRVANARSRDGGRARLNFGYQDRFGITVPEGNWNLP